MPKEIIKREKGKVKYTGAFTGAVLGEKRVAPGSMKGEVAPEFFNLMKKKLEGHADFKEAFKDLKDHVPWFAVGMAGALSLVGREHFEKSLQALKDAEHDIEKLAGKGNIKVEGGKVSIEKSGHLIDELNKLKGKHVDFLFDSLIGKEDLDYVAKNVSNISKDFIDAYKDYITKTVKNDADWEKVAQGLPLVFHDVISKKAESIADEFDAGKVTYSDYLKAAFEGGSVPSRDIPKPKKEAKKKAAETAVAEPEKAVASPGGEEINKLIKANLGSLHQIAVAIWGAAGKVHQDKIKKVRTHFVKEGTALDHDFGKVDHKTLRDILGKIDFGQDVKKQLESLPNAEHQELVLDALRKAVKFHDAKEGELKS